MGKNVFAIILEGTIAYITIMVMGTARKVPHIDLLTVEILEHAQTGPCVLHDHPLLEYHQVVGKAYETSHRDCSNCPRFIRGILSAQKEFTTKKRLNRGRETHLATLIVTSAPAWKEDLSPPAYVCNPKGIPNSSAVGPSEIGEIPEERAVREAKEEIGSDAKNTCHPGSQFRFHLSGSTAGPTVDHVGGDTYS